MKRLWLLSVFLLLTPAVGAWAQSTQLPEVTLYSPLKYGTKFEGALFNFQTGSTTPRCCRWDLTFGTLSVGENHDWFQVPVTRGSRTAFKDLGALRWDDSFSVPVVEPFARLTGGAQRQVVVNADGADGKPAPPKGWVGPSVSGEDSLRGSPIARGHLPPSVALDFPGSPGYVEQPWLLSRGPAPSPATLPKRQDGVPDIDPIFAKAVVGHIYAIHVVDDGVDYYALFRVESLKSGDRCTISWKLIPSPEDRDPHQAK